MLRQAAVTAHDLAYEVAFRPDPGATWDFVDTGPFYEANPDLERWNDTHLTRPGYEALGRWLAEARPMHGVAVLWLGDSWGTITSEGFRDGSRLVGRPAVHNASRAGRRYLDMVPTAPRAWGLDGVIVQGGVNDIMRGRADKAVEDVSRIARLARKPLTVVGVPPIPGHEDEVDRLNKELAQRSIH